MPKILVIDDSIAIQKLCSKVLADAGHQVTTASNGMEGITAAMSDRPAVIIMDVEMPTMDGLTAATLIKRTSLLAETPIVMLTSKDGVFDVARGELEGVSSYVIKPFSTQIILKAINEVLHEQ